MQNRKPLSVEEMYEDMSQVFFMQYVLHASCRVRAYEHQIWARTMQHVPNQDIPNQDIPNQHIPVVNRLFSTTAGSYPSRYLVYYLQYL